MRKVFGFLMALLFVPLVFAHTIDVSFNAPGFSATRTASNYTAAMQNNSLIGLASSHSELTQSSRMRVPENEKLFFVFSRGPASIFYSRAALVEDESYRDIGTFSFGYVMSEEYTAMIGTTFGTDIVLDGNFTMAAGLRRFEIKKTAENETSGVSTIRIRLE